MIRSIPPVGPDFEPDGRCEMAIAYGVTGDGREVVVYQRFFNVAMMIGPVGEHWYTEHW